MDCLYGRGFRGSKIAKGTEKNNSLQFNKWLGIRIYNWLGRFVKTGGWTANEAAPAPDDRLQPAMVRRPGWLVRG